MLCNRAELQFALSGIYQNEFSNQTVSLDSVLTHQVDKISSELLQDMCNLMFLCYKTTEVTDERCKMM